MADAKTQLSSRRDEAGLSLVEMAIVFMLISIVLCFAIPVVANSIRAYNLRNAAERLAERLAGGRALAMAKNKNVTVSVDTSTGRYGYDFSPAGAPDGTPDTSDPDDLAQSYYIETLPSGISGSFAAGGE